MHDGTTPERPAAAEEPGPSARALLLTVLGELVYPYDEPVWTSALLRVMRAMGFEDHAIRQAIARGAAAGWIESERHGRAVRWALAPHGRELVEDGMRRTAAFLAEPAAWDGRWLTLLVSIPQQQRAARKRLYGALSWLGLGNPTPGVWLTPHVEEAERVRAVVRELGLDGSALSFVGPVAGIGMGDDEIVRGAWDLEDLAGRYRALIARFEPLDPEPGDAMLVSHVALLNALQRFLRLDPELPETLLPDWVGREGAELFRRRRAEWTAGAHARWREIAAESAPA